LFQRCRECMHACASCASAHSGRTIALDLDPFVYALVYGLESRVIHEPKELQPISSISSCFQRLSPSARPNIQKNLPPPSGSDHVLSGILHQNTSPTITRGYEQISTPSRQATFGIGILGSFCDPTRCCASLCKVSDDFTTSW
jgi:hypothetical protein